MDLYYFQSRGVLKTNKHGRAHEKMESKETPLKIEEKKVCIVLTDSQAIVKKQMSTSKHLPSFNILMFDLNIGIPNYGKINDVIFVK